MVSAASLFIEAIADTAEGNVWIDYNFVELVKCVCVGVCMRTREEGWSFISITRSNSCLNCTDPIIFKWIANLNLRKRRCHFKKVDYILHKFTEKFIFSIRAPCFMLMVTSYALYDALYTSK